MNLNFPRDLIPCKSDHKLYKHLVDDGKRRASQLSIAFVGIARNVAHCIERNVRLCQSAGSLFKSHDIFIYENDSGDGTQDILPTLDINYKCDHREDKDYRNDLDTPIDPYHKRRSAILADLRNRYVEYLMGKPKFDYVAVLDWDLKGGFDMDGFFHSLALLYIKNDAACMTAYGLLSNPAGTLPLEQTPNGTFLMYDSFAFRPLSIPGPIFINKCGMFNHQSFTIGSPPVEVCSNFGGMGLYRGEVFHRHKYQSQEWTNMPGCVDCDHVCFHRKLREDGHKIYLNPSMLTSYVEHRYTND